MLLFELLQQIYICIDLACETTFRQLLLNNCHMAGHVSEVFSPESDVVSINKLLV